jgi:hypothetical protein
MKLSNHLTTIDAEQDARPRATFEGQAGWAMDPSHTCRECVLWTGKPDEKPERYAWKSIVGQLLKPRRCAKFFRLTNEWGPRIPHDATACRFFEPADRPPKALE